MALIVLGLGQIFSTWRFECDNPSGRCHEDQLSSLYWLNIMAGIVVFIIVAVSAPLVVSFYKEPRLRDITLYICLIFLITPFGSSMKFC